MREISKIIAAYDRVDWHIQKAALGTVVQVEGSSYRRIGARMFVLDSGEWVGGISGGCLEGDALRQAQRAMAQKEASMVVYDTTEDDPHQIGVGLGCNGRIEVLFQPIDGHDETNQIEFLKRIIDDRSPNLLLQVLSAANTRSVGSFYPEGRLADLCGDLDVSMENLKDAIRHTSYKRKSKAFTLRNKTGDEVQICCEWILPKIRLICLGENYDVYAMIGISRAMDWDLEIICRPRKLTKDMHEAATKLYTPEQLVDLDYDDYTALVLMSHDYKMDVEALKVVVDKNIPYIGVLGPRKRIHRMASELNEEGIHMDLATQTNLYSPVGLDIGAENPEEIALAIAAEILAVFRQRDGQMLRDRKGPIHE